MSSGAISLFRGTSRKISFEEASAGFVIPPAHVPAFMMRGDSLTCRRALFWGEFRHICSIATGGR